MTSIKVRENSVVRAHIIESLKKPRFKPKTWSVTRLLCCPRRTYYRMTGVYEFIPDEQVLIFTRGKAHHGILEVYPLKEIRREKDGIRGDIDMFGDRITEIYTTTLSLNKVKSPADVPKVFSIKTKQLAAYCYIEDELEGDLLVFFLFGDYSRFEESPVSGELVYVGLRPELKCWTLKFPPKYPKEVWERILMNREEIELALKDGVPPLDTGEEWECRQCGFSYKCLAEGVIDEKKIETDVYRKLKRLTELELKKNED